MEQALGCLVRAESMYGQPNAAQQDQLRAALAEPAVQEPRNHVGNSSFESWYADYDPIGKGDKQRARDAYAAGMGDPVYLPAPVQEPETVSVYGVKSNGEVVDTGVKAPMPPRMKAKEMVREMFGPWEEDDGSDSDLCFAVCEQFFEWLISQGWTAPQAQQPADVPMLTEDEVEAVQEGIAVDDFAHDLVRRTERLVRQKAGLQ